METRVDRQNQKLQFHRKNDIGLMILNIHHKGNDYETSIKVYGGLLFSNLADYNQTPEMTESVNEGFLPLFIFIKTLSHLLY